MPKAINQNFGDVTFGSGPRSTQEFLTALISKIESIYDGKTRFSQAGATSESSRFDRDASNLVNAEMLAQCSSTSVFGLCVLMLNNFGRTVYDGAKDNKEVLRQVAKGLDSLLEAARKLAAALNSDTVIDATQAQYIISRLRNIMDTRLKGTDGKSKSIEFGFDFTGSYSLEALTRLAAYANQIQGVAQTGAQPVAWAG
jgi:hypothetical protein